MKARNFAFVLIAASAMFAFACDDSDNTACDALTDKATCVDGNTIKVCVNKEWKESQCAAAAPLCKAGACVIDDKADCVAGTVKCLDASKLGTCGTDKKWTSEVCPNGCDTVANACKDATEKCTADSVACVNGAIETCVTGKDKKVENCAYGCAAGAVKCNDKPAEDSHMCDPALEATYKIGNAQPTPVYKWCCSNTDSKKAWTSSAGLITQWDCAAGCKEDPDEAGKMFCDKGETPTGSYICDPVVEATFVVGDPVPSPYKWCCSSKDSKKAWAGTTTIEQWDCAAGCKEDPKEAGRMFCDRGTTTDEACEKPAVAAGAKLGDACEGNDGICVDKNTWMYCSTSTNTYVINYCAGDCAADRTKGCGYQTCGYTSSQSDSTTACTKENYEGRCADDKKTGSFCTSSIVRTITCNSGYECKNDNGRIGCGPIAI